MNADTRVDDVLTLVRYLMLCGLDGGIGFADVANQYYWDQTSYAQEQAIWFDTHLNFTSCRTLADVGRACVALLEQGGEGSAIPSDWSLEDCGIEFIEHCGDTYKPFKKKLDCMKDIARTCFEHAMNDPLEDPQTSEYLWKTLGSASSVIPFDSFYVFQDKWPFLEDLIAEKPDLVLDRILDTQPCTIYNRTFDEDVQAQLDARYETLLFLVSSRMIDTLAVELTKNRGDSKRARYYCPDGASHVMFRLFDRTDPECCTRDRRTMMRQHLKRMLGTLLSVGEDPLKLCSCNESWNRTGGGSRSIACVASEKGFLDVWRSALNDFGCFSLIAADGWALRGILELFGEADEPVPGRKGFDHSCLCPNCASVGYCDMALREQAVSTSDGPVQQVAALAAAVLSSIV